MQDNTLIWDFIILNSRTMSVEKTVVPHEFKMKG